MLDWFPYTLQYPWMLLLIPIGLLYLFWINKQKKIAKTLAFTGKNTDFKSFFDQRIEQWRKIEKILLGISFIATIFCLTYPVEKRMVDKHNIYESEGIDIMIAMDISNSMLATDFIPNRLEVTKIMANSFIEKRKFDRIGLVVYEGEAITACPLTLDHEILKQALLGMNPGAMNPGTAIGSGLANAVARLTDTSVKSRIIILMTDGVNNQGETTPELATEMAIKAGIKVYTIGIGSNNGIADIMGQQIEVKIDEDVMRSISNQTGGKYFRATDSESMSSIYAEIDQMETVKREDRRVQPLPPPVLSPFLFIAILALIGSQIIHFSKLKSLV